MVNHSMIENLRTLLARAGAQLTIRHEDGDFYYVADEFEPARQKLVNYDTRLTSEIETLSRKVALMTANSDPVSDFWALTDKVLDQHPGMKPSAARFETMVLRPELAAAAGIPGAVKASRKSTKPPADSSHYYDLFFSLALKYEAEHKCTDFEARAAIARQHPALRTAAFSREAKEKYFAACKYENELGLTLDLAYKAAAGFLPLSAMEAL